MRRSGGGAKRRCADGDENGISACHDAQEKRQGSFAILESDPKWTVSKPSVGGLAIRSVADAKKHCAGAGRLEGILVDQLDAFARAQLVGDMFLFVLRKGDRLPKLANVNLHAVPMWIDDKDFGHSEWARTRLATP